MPKPVDRLQEEDPREVGDRGPAEVFRSMGELRGALGRPLEPGPWCAIDQDRIDAFADVTLDRQWIHVDPVRAATGLYGGTVAHGFLTLSLLPWLMSQVFVIDTGTPQLNYGINSVRFPHFVRSGQAVRLIPKLTQIVPHRIGHMITIESTVEIRGEAKPACVAETLTLLLV